MPEKRSKGAVKANTSACSSSNGIKGARAAGRTRGRKNADKAGVREGREEGTAGARRKRRKLRGATFSFRWKTVSRLRRDIRGFLRKGVEKEGDGQQGERSVGASCFPYREKGNALSSLRFRPSAFPACSFQLALCSSIGRYLGNMEISILRRYA